MVWRHGLAALFAFVSLTAVAVQGMTFQEAAFLSQDDALELWKKHQTLLPAGATWPSQLGQDRWAATFAFPTNSGSANDIITGTADTTASRTKSNFPQGVSNNAPRYFVEVGAADGLDLSNTYALEAHLGWRGLCVEANPSSLDLLRTNRPACQVVDAVVGARSGEVVQFTSFANEANRLFSGVAANEYYHLFGSDGELTNASRAHLEQLKNRTGTGGSNDGRHSTDGSKSENATVVTRTTDSLADLLVGYKYIQNCVATCAYYLAYNCTQAFHSIILRFICMISIA
jgi:hypothetical protein